MPGWLMDPAGAPGGRRDACADGAPATWRSRPRVSWWSRFWGEAFADGGAATKRAGSQIPTTQVKP